MAMGARAVGASLPEADKLRYFDPAMAGARGYTPFGTEIAKGAKQHDLKEFWHVGRDLPPGSPLADASMPPNVWPAQPEGFQLCVGTQCLAPTPDTAEVASRL